MHDKIENVGQAFKLSRRARAIIRQNITISLGMIFLLLISALAQKINLTTGVIGHEGSTVSSYLMVCACSDLNRNELLCH